MKKLNKLFLMLICVFPVVMFFSYYPVISLGSGEAMNFELSLPLVWLVLFDVLGIVMLFRRDGVLGGVRGIFMHWKWLLFPAFLSISCLWSGNMVRGVLTAGILWAIYLAGYIIYSFRELFDLKFKDWFSRIFIGSSLVMCGILVLQCVLDLCGVSREYTMMCPGCTYRMFGFPHPNGFAIEPQFMGNLLLAPMLVVAYMWLTGPADFSSPVLASLRAGGPLRSRHPSTIKTKNSDAHLGRNLRKPLRVLLLVVFSSSLFLTFSRGAIYAGMVGLVVLSIANLPKRLTRDILKAVRPSLWSRAKRFRSIGILWLTVILSFLFTLNLQGVMAEVSKTDDTYISGVAKVLNHLSLGVIDIRENRVEKEAEEASLGIVGAGEVVKLDEVLEDDEKVIGLDEILDEERKEEAYFDGYVAESTDVRVGMTGAAVRTWQKDIKTILIGTGLGGAGVAMYENGETEWSKEIVQNQYASLLLETGIVGISLLIISLVLLIREVLGQKQVGLILALMVAYGISLLFFSGLPNVLHIYSLSPLLMCMNDKKRLKEIS